MKRILIPLAACIFIFTFFGCEDYDPDNPSGPYLKINEINPPDKGTLADQPVIQASLAYILFWDHPDYSDSKLNYFDEFKVRLSIQDTDGSWFTLDKYTQIFPKSNAEAFDFVADLSWFFDNEDVHWASPYFFRFSILVAPGVVYTTKTIFYH